MTPHRVPFMDLTPGEDAGDVREAIDRVVTRGWFVLGPEVEAFESEFAAACGVPHAIGVGNGTDALLLLLKGLDIGPGDEVIVPAMTAAYSGLAVTMAGATPVFADVDPDTLLLSPEACRAAVTTRTAAIMPVHLYGQAANMTAIEAIAHQHGLAIVEDCATAVGARYDGVHVGLFIVLDSVDVFLVGFAAVANRVDVGAIVTSDGAPLCPAIGSAHRASNRLSAD